VSALEGCGNSANVTVHVPPLGSVKIAWPPDDRPGPWMAGCQEVVIPTVAEQRYVGSMFGKVSD